MIALLSDEVLVASLNAVLNTFQTVALAYIAILAQKERNSK